MIPTITKSNTPAPIAPITASKFWPVFSDCDSTKSKLFCIEETINQLSLRKRFFLFSKTDNLKYFNNNGFFYRRVLWFHQYLFYAIFRHFP